ncbi:MAG: hypothetical protein AAGJ94_04425 [Pseudomonadota bacterium]
MLNHKPLPSLGGSGSRGDMGGLARAQNAWRCSLAEEFYGFLPKATPTCDVVRVGLGEGRAERLIITLSHEGGTLTIDAAVWWPYAAPREVPLVIGLSFLGPAGVLMGEEFPLDPTARVSSDLRLGLNDKRLQPHIRGAHAARWPLALFAERGVALLLSCYGSWVPDDPQRWQDAGLAPFLNLGEGPHQSGAISLWAYALSRLVDVAVTLPEIDAARIAVAGHSRLGKAALWAAAHDARISTAIIHNAGTLGPALASHSTGETLMDLATSFPHWVSPSCRARLNAGITPTVDQHQALASIAPRNVIVGSAALDAWADPVAEYLGLCAAAPAFAGATELPAAEEVFGDAIAPMQSVLVRRGPLAYHLRPGGHDLLPADWRVYLSLLDAF